MINLRNMPGIGLLFLVLLCGSAQVDAASDLLGKARADSEESTSKSDPTSPAEITRRAEKLAALNMFREHNITIAFPQRDVHLDAHSPIQVQMVPDGQHQPGAEPKDRDDQA